MIYSLLKISPTIQAQLAHDSLYKVIILISGNFYTEY